MQFINIEDAMPLTYSSYLKLDELLSLQQIKSPDEHDEMLFIIIHQAYELWFKQILHEADYIAKLLESDDITAAKSTLKRILTILKVLVHQVDILETMSPTEFLSFRNYLESASGFQSYQFRELEFLLGLKSEAQLIRFPEGSEIRSRLDSRYYSPSLWLVFLRFLKRAAYNIPDELTDDNTITGMTKPSKELQLTFVEIYKNDPPVSQFCELLVDLDEGIQEWRYRHVKMVERTIGGKPGTGGSLGVRYLKNTLFIPIFPDLWEVRSEF